MFEASKQGAVHVISCNGPLTEANVALARQAYEPCFGKEQPRMVMRLGSVQLIDSAGLEFLLDLRDRCLRSGGALQLATPNPLCQDILQATGLASQFAIFDNVNAAVGSFAQ